MVAQVFSWPDVCMEVELGQWEEYFGTTAAAFPSEYSGRDSVSVPCLDTMLRVAAAASSLTALDVDWVGAEGTAPLFLWDTEMSRTLGYERRILELFILILFACVF